MAKNDSKLSPFNNFNCDMKYIACIGENSGIHRTERDGFIIDGYKKTAELIFNAIDTDSGKIFTDIAVYPLFFCCRHTIELYLKMIIKKLLILYKLKNSIQTEDTLSQSIQAELGTHSIRTLVNKIELLKTVDPKIIKTIVELDGFVDYVADYDIDDSSDTFRYTYKKNHKDINLKDQGQINLKLLYTKFVELEERLDYFYNYFCENLHEQYSTKTFTKKLSRIQLEEISKMLPDRKSWKSLAFSEAKNKIQQKYNLTNSEFSEALNKIQGHYAFSLNIGFENKFKDIRPETFEKICGLVNMVEKIDILRPVKMGKILEIHPTGNKDIELEAKFCNDGLQIFKTIPMEEIYALLSFIEMGRQGIFCESLDNTYSFWENRYKYPDRYILNKICNSRTVETLTNSFKKCGQITYLELLKKYYKYTKSN